MTSPSAPLLAALRGQLQRRERVRLPADVAPISTGVTALDELLPWGGLRPGSLVEYLAGGQASAGRHGQPSAIARDAAAKQVPSRASSEACPCHPAGAAVLALAAARAACRDGRTLVVADRRRQFYPPAAAAWGIDLSQTVLLRPASVADELWVVDQALRCGGVGAVCTWCGAIGGRDFRRLQLAAESGGTLGLLIRGAHLRGQPTWADVQWLVEPQPSSQGWRVRVELVRCRGAAGGRSVLLELDEQTVAWDSYPEQTARDGNPRLREAGHSHETHLVHPPAELADPAAARRRARA